MKWFFIFKFILYIANTYSTINNNLSNYQWKLIKSLIKNKSTTPIMRNYINQLIYNKYETWAIHKAFEFKKIHKYKCRNININDLKLYSLEGLKLSTLKYNGSYNFHLYASIYIQGNLYKGITDLHPITNIPKHIRKGKTGGIKSINKFYYKKLLNTQFVGYNEYWMFEKKQHLTPYNDKEYNNEKMLLFIWKNINEIVDPFSKRIFKYKYNYYLEKMNSNKIIGELMCCSEENIRFHINKIITMLKTKIKSNYDTYEN
jgi:hypothetical protein